MSRFSCCHVSLVTCHVLNDVRCLMTSLKRVISVVSKTMCGTVWWNDHLLMLNCYSSTKQCIYVACRWHRWIGSPWPQCDLKKWPLPSCVICLTFDPNCVKLEYLMLGLSNNLYGLIFTSLIIKDLCKNIL